MSKHNRNHNENVEKSNLVDENQVEQQAAPVADEIKTEQEAPSAAPTATISADELAALLKLREEDAKRKARASKASKASREARLAKETPEQTAERKEKAKKASQTSNMRRKAIIEEMKRKLAAYEAGNAQVTA